MATLLNWFPFERLPETLSVKSRSFGTWDQTKPARLAAEKAAARWHALTVDQKPTVMAYANASALGPDWTPLDLRIADGASTSLVNVVLEQSLADHLRSRMFDVTVTRHGISGFPPHTQRHSALDIRPGVHVYAFRPDLSSDYGVAINWEVRVRFTKSLANSRLRSIAIGTPVVVLDPARRTVAQLERQPFAGILLKINSTSHGVLRTRIGEMAEIALSEYTLEATPRTLVKYGALGGDSPRRLWQEIQRLNFSLDEHGSRNRHVLRDRLQAIRTVLSEPGARSLEFDLCTAPGTRIVLGLQPFDIGPADVYA